MWLSSLYLRVDDLSGNFENMTAESGGNGTGSFEMINSIDQPTDTFSAPGESSYN